MKEYSVGRDFHVLWRRLLVNFIYENILLECSGRSKTLGFGRIILLESFSCPDILFVLETGTSFTNSQKALKALNALHFKIIYPNNHLGGI